MGIPKMACVFLRLILQGLLSTNIGDSITQAFIFGLVRCTHCFAHSFKNSIKRTTFWDEDVETPLKWPYISSNSSFLLKGFHRKGFLIPFFLISLFITVHQPEVALMFPPQKQKRQLQYPLRLHQSPTSAYHQPHHSYHHPYCHLHPIPECSNITIRKESHQL